jgi:predicted HTH transcriptional regulator
MLNDQELLLKLTDQEDSFVERKTVNDINDCLKTAVAFANSTPIGYPAVMFVGVRDTGEVEGVSDPEKIQNSVSERISRAYPTIYTTTRVLAHNGKQFLAVIIPGSDRRPHFAGDAFIRDGAKSIRASEEQFQRLLAQRNSVAYELLKWHGKAISTWQPQRTPNPYNPSLGYTGLAIMLDCTQFYVTLEVNYIPVSYSLASFDIGFDHMNHRLEIRFHAPT